MFDAADNPFISPPDLCERYNGTITVETLEKWRRDGRGPDYYKFGGKVLYRLADIHRWEATQRRTQGKPVIDSHLVRRALEELDALDGRAA